jgi:hypothetical protein
VFQFADERQPKTEVDAVAHVIVLVERLSAPLKVKGSSNFPARNVATCVAVMPIGTANPPDTFPSTV